MISGLHLKNNQPRSQNFIFSKFLHATLVIVSNLQVAAELSNRKLELDRSMQQFYRAGGPSNSAKVKLLDSSTALSGEISKYVSFFFHSSLFFFFFFNFFFFFSISFFFFFFFFFRFFFSFLFFSFFSFFFFWGGGGGGCRNLIMVISSLH